MNALQHNLAEDSTLEIEPRCQKKNKKKAGEPEFQKRNLSSVEYYAGLKDSELCLENLNSNMATTKEWALEIGVSDRYVRQLSNREKPILEKHVRAILAASVKFRSRQAALDAATQMRLVERYQNDPGLF